MNLRISNVIDWIVQLGMGKHSLKYVLIYSTQFIPTNISFCVWLWQVRFVIIIMHYNVDYAGVGWEGKEPIKGTIV